MLPPPAPPPTPSEWVAPGPDTLSRALDELERRVTVAESLAHASARWQNQRRPTERTCDDTAAPYLHFADAWHGAAQRARTQQDRVRWLWEAPTLADVRTDDLVARWVRLDDRADGAARAWMVFRSWHQRYGPRCKTRPVLSEAAAGPPSDQLHAVWVVEGLLCGATGVEPRKVDGTDAWLVDGPVCVATSDDCSCTPAPTRPGQVLAP